MESKTTFTGSSTHTTMYVHVETRREYYERRSSEYADAAMHWALGGKLITMELCAEMADLHAALAQAVALIESGLQHI